MVGTGLKPNESVETGFKPVSTGKQKSFKYGLLNKTVFNYTCKRQNYYERTIRR